MSSDGRISLTIGTAGHVDHGKTTLVRYLTGTDTDRLEEEHRRGISIVPGYAELQLPGGGRASLIDVPGHERFVKNMVAGATGVDAFMLVVAADDGVMPQTREHLDVLRVLGIERGVVALTKIDMVDEEMVELARLDVEELLEAAGISAEVFPVSGVTGDGTDDLLNALAELAEGGVSGRVGGGLARLPVDRAFVLKGIGVVVTGTLWTGEITAGDILHSDAGKSLRVRGVQNHGHPAKSAYPGARTALDVTGVEVSEVEPGDVLLSSPVPPTSRLDVRLRLLESAKPLRHGLRVRLHHGTKDVNARVRLRGMDEVSPGGDAIARLHLDEPMTLLAGDRFVLRSLTPQVTIGGGTVLDVAPEGRHPDPEWLEALEKGDLERTIPTVLSRNPENGMTPTELAVVLSSDAESVEKAANVLADVRKVEEFYALSEALVNAEKALLQRLGRLAEERPENPEMTVAEARTATNLSGRLADAVISSLASEEAGDDRKLNVSGSGVRLFDADEVPEEMEREASELLQRLAKAAFEPPTMDQKPALRLLLKRGDAVSLGGGLFAAREAADRVLEEVIAACREDGDISLSGLRDRLDTSRKFSQAWLEFADAERVTVRTGDVRVLTRRFR